MLTVRRVKTARVARMGHPSFFRASWSICAAAVFAVLSLGGSPAWSMERASYRLAGVVAVGSEYLGFLEIAAGDQILIRKDSIVPGGGRVIAFDSRSVRIAFPDKVVELALEGGAGSDPGVVTRGIVTAQDDAMERIHVRSVEAATLQQALAQPVTSDASTPAGAIQRRGRKDEGAAVAMRFSALVNLPADSRVLAVNEQPVVSAAAAIETVNRTLAAGMPARLNISNSAGADQRVYLLPERD
jgi:hypothetical protein